MLTLATPSIPAHATSSDVHFPSDSVQVTSQQEIHSKTLSDVQRAHAIVHNAPLPLRESQLSYLRTTAPQFYDFLHQIDPSDLYATYFALETSKRDLDELGARLHGSHFEMQYNPEMKTGSLRILKGDKRAVIDPILTSRTTRGGRAYPQGALFNWKCWQAAFAFTAWAAAWGMTCSPAGPAGSIFCSTVAGLVFTPDFNASCPK